MADAMSAVRPLGEVWTSTRGTGRLQQDQREELKNELLRDLAARPGVRVDGGVVDEVERFLDSGRVSDSNLSRLERRVMGRCRGGPSSARSESGSAVSDFSLATSRLEGPRSARLPAGSGGGAASSTMPPVPEQQPLLPEGPISKWSEVAKYSKALELKEKQQKLQTLRSNQKQMAQDLELQINIKQNQKKASREEERRLFEHQEAELVQWKQAQTAQQEEIRRRALEVKKERELQNAANQQRKEEERQAKMLEDSQLVERAVRELDQERQMHSARKASSKAQQFKMWQDSKQQKADAGELRKVQVEEERRKVKEYHHMLEEQERRNKQVIPPIRGINAVIVGPPGGRRGDDFYTEANVMRQLHQANALAENAEQEKIRNIKEQRLSNQDYLFQQIAERNKNREKDLEQKKQQKQQAQAATAEYLDSERKRIEDQRTKNIQYRLDLEKQMAAKRAAVKPKSMEDMMSFHEKAINQHLIKEAEDLKQEHQLQPMLALGN